MNTNKNADKNAQAVDALTEMDKLYFKEVGIDEMRELFPDANKKWDKQDVAEFHIKNNEDIKDFSNGK